MGFSENETNRYKYEAICLFIYISSISMKQVYFSTNFSTGLWPHTESELSITLPLAGHIWNGECTLM